MNEQEVFDRLMAFATLHGLDITPARGNIQRRIKIIADLDCRCPCKPKERTCPCPESINEANTTGECFCRLFEKKGWDWGKDKKKPKKKGL